MSARRVLSSLALTLLAAACAKPAEQTAAAPPAVDSAAVKAGVADLWARYIVADTAGNLDALANMVQDSARLDIRGMPPMLGRAAYRTMAEQGFKEAKYTSMTITPEMTMAVSNELAYETGNYMEGYTAGKKNLMDFGRYATAVAKDADGQWRIAYIMAFADSTVTVKK